RCELRHTGSSVHMTMVQLPGLNTPQFEHCLAKTPNHPMPVPPIYQPEVAARAVYWAAHSRRREHYVGVPTVYTIWGNKLAPWFAEWYLSRTGFESQQMPSEPLDPDRPVNLYEPIPEDEGAHGRFDDQAHDKSVQAWLAEHKGALGAAAAAGAGAVVTGLLSLRR
ncbi:MAG TPA: hypothetical protein VFG61_00590, partial [Gaiellaceae bacterium]|nr:hypothetical protein [Gaiellaceae bacterium]